MTRGADIPFTSVAFPFRELFAAQARLLAKRAERNLPIGDSPMENLERIYRDIVVEELLAEVELKR